MGGRKKATPDYENGALPPRDMAYEYRRMVGAWLSTERQNAGMTQAELGKALGVGFTAVSAWEVGRGTLAPEHYFKIIEVLNLEKKPFAKKMLRWTNPWLYFLLFGENDAALKAELDEIPVRYRPVEVPNKVVRLQGKQRTPKNGPGRGTA